MPRLTRRAFVDLSVKLSLGNGLIALAGCGSGGSDHSTNPTPTPPGTLITPTARAAAVNAVMAKFTSLPHSSAADDNQRLLTFLQGNAAFTAAGAQPGGCVWARFTDGTPLVIINDGSVTATSGGPGGIGRLGGMGGVGSAVAPTSMVAPTELPSAKKVFLSNNISRSVTPDGIVNALLGGLVAISFDPLAADLGNVGYSVSKLSGSIAELKTITNADVLYLYAHLGLYLNSANKLLLGLSTTTPLLDTTFTSLDLATYNSVEQDILDGNIAFVLYLDFDVSNARPLLKPYYMILPPFIDKYLSFSNHSLVFINGCAAFSTAFGPQANILAAFGLSNVEVYASWDQPVDGVEALLSGQMLMKGMAGKYVPGSGPPVRPFAYPDMLTFMGATLRSGRSYGYDKSVGIQGAATLELFQTKNGAALGILAPSIASLQPTEGTLTIAGSFGATQGTVTIGGVSVDVQSWVASRIICTLPNADQAGGCGEVVVTVNGLKSNPVRLTAWQVTFRYANSFNSSSASTQFDTLAGTYTLTATLQLWLRADIHKGRALPGDTPPSTAIVTDVNGLSLPTKMAKLTSYSIAGTITHTVHTGNINNPVDKTVLETVTPDGSAPYPYDGTVSALPTQQSAFSLISRGVTLSTGSLKIFLRAVLPTYSTRLSDTSVLGVASYSGILSSQGLGPGGDGTISMNFDANGNIAGGSAPPNGTATLSWDSASPVGGSGPDPSAAC